MTGAPNSVTLANGATMPLLGLGTWKSPKGKTGDAVKAAIDAGYRLIDTANDYGNEDEIGLALAEVFAAGIVSRSDLFIQSKLWNSNHRKEHVRLDLLATLKDLQIDYVDSFVIHWPQACPATGTEARLASGGNGPAPASESTLFPTDEQGRYCTDKDCHFIETWHAMEDLVDEGLAKSIGLSNFNMAQVREVQEKARKHQPVILQNECHPYLQQKDIIDFCKLEGIQFQSYSPLGSGDRPWAKPGDVELLKDPELAKMAQKYNKSIAQLVVRWHLQRGLSCVPKSVTPSRILENFSVLDIELSRDDMMEFDRFNKGWRHCRVLEMSNHPDYPFKDSVPHGYIVGPAMASTTSSHGQ